MKLGLLKRVTRWRRHRLKTALGWLGPAELDLLLDVARLWERWPRRWWFIEEGERVQLIGE